MLKVKVLPLEAYNFKELPSILHERHLEDLNDYCEEIDPVFFRDGTYLIGEFCWFETLNRAFKYDKEQFKYRLELLNASEMDKRVLESLVDIDKFNESFLDKKSKRLVFMYKRHKELKAIKARTTLDNKRMLARIRKHRKVLERG